MESTTRERPVSTKFGCVYLSKLSACCLAVCLTLLFMILVIFRGASWETNDDSAMIRALALSDNSYSPFLGRLLSRILHVLYVSQPSVSHWVIFTYVFIGIGLSAVIYVILRRYPIIHALLFSLLLLVVAWKCSLELLNFTRTSAAVAFGGMAMIANAVFPRSKSGFLKAEYVLGIILLLISTQIRLECTLIALAFLAVISAVELLYYNFCFTSQWFISHLRPVLLLISAVILVGMAVVGNRLLLSDEEKLFEEYNHYRAEIVDYPSRYQNWEEKEALTGLSTDDLNSFLHWLSEDTEVFDLGTLQKVAQAGDKFGSFGDLEVRITESPLVIVLLLLSGLTIMLRKQLRGFVDVVLPLVMAAGLLVYLAYSGRIPSRVFMSILYGAFVACAVLGAVDPQEERKTNRVIMIQRIFSAVLLLAVSVTSIVNMVCCFVGVFHSGQKPNGDSDIFETIRNGAYDTINENSQNLYLFPALSPFNSIYYAFGPWDAVPTDYCSNLYFLGGWEARMPVKVERLATEGISNPIKALYEKKNIYSIYSDVVLDHLHRHYNDHITASGVSGKWHLMECQVIQYCAPISETNMPSCSVSATAEEFHYQILESRDTWWLSGYLDRYPDNMIALYCNLQLDGHQYTYRVSVSGCAFSAYFYNIPETFDPDQADVYLIAELSDGTYQRIELKYLS